MEINYEKDIQIDPETLDLEWLNQPDLTRKYSKYAALMEKSRDETKERLEFIKAKLELDIRNSPEKYGLQKITEGAIQSVLTIQEKYQEAVQKYNDTKYEYNIAIGAVRAFDQRKTALENLVRLLSVSYFAGPVSPRNLGEQLEQRQNEKQEESNKKVKIRKPKTKRTT